MNLAEMDLRQYCALNRARFYVDPVEDAGWLFGNAEVQADLVGRMRSDIDVRGVPKCGVVGRYGIGKTHALNHVKWLLDQKDGEFPLRAFRFDIVWDESNGDLNSWRGIHGRMLDSMGELFLREIVRLFDARSKSDKTELAEAIQGTFRFGDENLRLSLATVLAEYFKRDVKNTGPAWQWLRGEKGVKLDQLGVPKQLHEGGDMVNVILNLGALYKEASGLGIVFLMDEAQYLADIRKAEGEVHRAFVKMADQDNRDVGFVLAIMGSGVNLIPKVFTAPDDMLSRMGVTKNNLNEAFIDLQKIMLSRQDIRDFMGQVLDHLVNKDEAAELIRAHALEDVSADRLPYSERALDRIAEVMYSNEFYRNPRMIIDVMARCCSRAYRLGKESGKYQTVGAELVDEVVGSM